MGTRYRVTVEQIDDVEGAQYETNETILFETVSPSLLSLLRYAPTEVDAALREAAGIGETFSREVADGWSSAAVVARVYDRQGAEIGGEPEQAPAAGSEPEQVVAPAKQRKPRRTAAQKAADEEAARAAGERMQAAMNGGAEQQEQTVEAMALPVEVPQAEQVQAAAEAIQQHANGAAAEVGHGVPAEHREPEPGTSSGELLATTSAPPAGEVWNPFKR